VKAAGGCGSVLIVIFCIVLYAFGMAFASYWVSRWLEAGSGVRTPFTMFPYIFKHLYIRTKYLDIQSLNYAVFLGVLKPILRIVILLCSAFFSQTTHLLFLKGFIVFCSKRV